MDFGGDAPGQNTLNFRSGPKAGDTINIGPKTMTVGRSPDNDIVIDDPTVSRQHARITFDGNQFYVEDLNSTSGTKINGKNVAKEAIMAGATMKMGNTEIGFNNNGGYQEKFPPQGIPASGNPGETRVIGKSPAGMTWLAGTAGAAAGQTCPLKEGNNTIGRDADNDVVLDDPYASRQHAVVRVEDGKAHLFDLGSSGGTKVNGKEIGGGRVEPNSVIRVGETELSLLQVDNPKQFAQATMSGNTMVDRRGEQVGVLVVKSGVDAGKSFMLSEGDNSIGRGNDAAINLSDESVSRQHAVIRCQDGKLTLFDVGSSSAGLDQALDGTLDIERARTKAGVDVDQQRQVADIRDAAHIDQYVFQSIDTQIRQTQRTGGDTTARQVESLEAGALGQQGVVGVDGTNNLQRTFGCQCFAETFTRGVRHQTVPPWEVTASPCSCSRRSILRRDALICRRISISASSPSRSAMA